jgi:hypothetical protein
MQELARTADQVKLTALRAALEAGGVNAEVFDAAAGALWRQVIPVRLMVADDDLSRARLLLAQAGFHRAGDNDWDT